MAQNDTPELSHLIKCTVISCPNHFHKDLPPSKDDCLFFSFPPDESTATVWKEKCGVSAGHPTTTAKVCSDHFKPADYTDGSKALLKPDAIPKDNLGWMVGMPEVKLLSKRPKFDLIKDAVDTNERLTQRFDKLIKEQKPLKDKIELYKKKIENVDNEVFRLKNMIAKFPARRKNGAVTVNLISKVFSPAQINMLLGKKKVVWSYDDMAMAFTLRHIGNRECYLYLKDTLNVPLPALAAVQRWVASNKP
ncbi:hypothetical protein MTP99_004980 [Tenebrio molitor]|jgi:hypothetical protein|nr:hypothetical protein MTP99_004980 [Tenebrio molitor]